MPVEVQFRTIAMDFWASLEHKIYYKYATRVPEELLESLKDAAETAAELDQRMERLHGEIRGRAAGDVAGGARVIRGRETEPRTGPAPRALTSGGEQPASPTVAAPPAAGPV